MFTFPHGYMKDGVVVPYAPGMMTYGAGGYYTDTTVTTAGNKVTVVARFNIAAFTGGSNKYIFNHTNVSSSIRATAIVYSSDNATTEVRSKLLVIFRNSAGGDIGRFLSIDAVADGSDKLLWCAYDGDSGLGKFYINGVDADDTGYTGRALTTGTLTTGASHIMTVGGSNHVSGGNTFQGGKIGYFGIRDAYLTNPTDFYSGGIKELDETGWTEWGAQPLFWNQYGTMTANAGSAGNMTANGTITGPA